MKDISKMGGMMSTVKKVIITTIVVVVVALGIWWLVIANSPNSNQSTSETTGQEETSQQPAENQEAAVTITYDGNEFAPASVTVKVGDVVKIINNSENVLYFASDEHPTHLDNSELNVGDIEPGSIATFTVSSAGTWGYHDHYNASADGEIIAN